MNIGIIIAIAVIGIWAIGVFLGVIGGVSKTFTNPPPSAIDTTTSKSQEQQIIQQTEEKRRELMDDMKQKMEDAGH